MRHAGGDPRRPKKKLERFLDDDVQPLPEDADPISRPSLGFNRAVQRAAMHVQSSGKKELKGANVLVAIFAERDCPAEGMLARAGRHPFRRRELHLHGVSKSGQDDLSREEPRGASPYRADDGDGPAPVRTRSPRTR